MGKTYRELKIKIAQLRFENSFLTSKVEKVLLENNALKLKNSKEFKDIQSAFNTFNKALFITREEKARIKKELQVSNARIVELAQEIELLRNGLPFAEEAKEALEGFSVGLDYVPTEFEHLVSFGYMQELTVPEKNKTSPMHLSSDADRELELFARANALKKEEKAFASRFMPNVKFKISGHRQELEDAKLPMMMFADFGKVESDGSFTGSASAPQLFESWGEKEVSIYEAIPELVPEGMVYDKESDSLVKKS